MTDMTAVLQGTHNARELGGLPTTDGGSTASGVLYRSDALSTLTESGIRAITDQRIGTIIDLRTDTERARATDLLPTDDTIQIITLPVLGGAMDQMVRDFLPTGGAAELTEQQIAGLLAQIPTLEALYISILSSSAAQFTEVARAVIEASGTDRPGVLFHCTAGKDRTGLAAALLLSVAGVPREAIVEDYTLTGPNLAGAFSEGLTALIASMGLPLTPQLTRLATEAPASAIEAALDWIATNHGDAAGYLQAGGMTHAEIDALRQALRAA